MLFFVSLLALFLKEEPFTLEIFGEQLKVYSPQMNRRKPTLTLQVKGSSRQKANADPSKLKHWMQNYQFWN